MMALVGECLVLVLLNFGDPAAISEIDYMVVSIPGSGVLHMQARCSLNNKEIFRQWIAQ